VRALFGRCEAQNGMAAFDRLVEQVMAQEPYRSARRVFWITDNGSAHRGPRGDARLQQRWPTLIPVHTLRHATWLNQIEIYLVRNDVRLAGESRLLVVSGSNMSGKSTLLRTVGINAVMALAGAPVRAVSLRLSPLSMGATLRIQDSLLEGRSRFYAEITRIRTLADLAAGPVPLLFLLDELFHGTNSHDRLLGAEGVLRSLLDSGAIGLITTHDLALTAIADELTSRAVNVHFEDWFEDGDITFDYRMKSGPVTRSNALALMRAVGLEVASSTEGLNLQKSRGSR
jgi:DNA mismatch repair ATPase MutS